jgi:hypothetical protein
MQMDKKQYTVLCSNDFTPYDIYEQAEERARRLVAKAGASPSYAKAFIFESVAVVQAPIPEAVVTKIT